MNGDLYKEILDNIDVGVYFVDKNGIITFWNKGAEKITGYSAGEVLNRRCADNILVHVDEEGNNLCMTMCPLMDSISEGVIRTADIYLHHKNGHRVPITTTIIPIRNDEGEIMGAVETFRDNPTVIAEKMLLQDLKKAASLDPLTEIPNRRFIETKVMASLEELKRHGLTFGIIFCDIDSFKAVNDTYGHLTGDNVLKMVAGTLSENIRAYDLVGRWGGEEFLLVISHVSETTMIKIANKLRLLVKSSFVDQDGTKISVTLTMGATMAHVDDTLHSLVERADGYMYRGKMAGRDCVIHDIKAE